MIIDEKTIEQLKILEHQISNISKSNSLTEAQVEIFLRNFEKTRYNVLTEIKKYNTNVQYKYEKISTIDDEYKANIDNGMLKIYIPETMPNFKNMKTHTYKRILLNVAEITKPFNNLYNDEVFVYIKVFDNISCWDIDNKCVKPIADGLITSGVIKDDNISKMFYSVKGELSEKPHTEVYILNGKKVGNFLEKFSSN